MLKEKKNNNKIIITIGIILILLGTFLISSNYLFAKRQKAYDEISFVLSDLPEVIEDDTSTIEEENTETPSGQEAEQPKTYVYNSESVNDFTLSQSYYIGKLIIPKINFAKGFASQNASQNMVDKNIQVISPSDYPDVTNGNFIVAGHAGNSWNSFFRNLKELRIGNEAEVYYKNKIYVYKLVKIYNQPRGSKLKIYRNQNKTTMTLITCSMTDRKSQTIFIFER